MKSLTIHLWWYLIIDHKIKNMQSKYENLIILRINSTYHSGHGSFSTHWTLTVFNAEISPSMPSLHSSGATYRKVPPKT